MVFILSVFNEESCSDFSTAGEVRLMSASSLRVTGFGAMRFDAVRKAPMGLQSIPFYLKGHLQDSSTYIPARSPYRANRHEPEKHISLIFKYHQEDKTSIVAHVICDAEYRIWSRMECCGTKAATLAVGRLMSTRLKAAGEAAMNITSRRL